MYWCLMRIWYRTNDVCTIFMCTQTQLKKLSVHTFPDLCYVNDIYCIAFCMLQFPGVHIYIYTHMYIYIYTLIVYMHTHTYIYIWTHIYIYVHIFKYMYIYIFIYTTLIYDYIYVPKMYDIHTAIWQAGGGASPELFEELCQKAARRCRLWTRAGECQLPSGLRLFSIGKIWHFFGIFGFLCLSDSVLETRFTRFTRFFKFIINSWLTPGYLVYLIYLMCPRLTCWKQLSIVDWKPLKDSAFQSGHHPLEIFCKS